MTEESGIKWIATAANMALPFGREVCRRQAAAMTRISRLLIVAALCCCASALGQTGDDRQTNAARQLWDRIVQAKGGRERLHAVNNILIHLRAKGKYDVTLFSFPDKSWEWFTDIYGKDPTVRLFNGSSGVTKYIKRNGSELPSEPSLRAITVEPIPFLLETKLLQPLPLSVSRHRFGKETLDVVRTEMNWCENYWVDFAVEPDSLMVRVISFWKKDPNYSPNPSSIMCFSDYTEVDGIKVAQKMNELTFFPPGIDIDTFDLKKCRYRSVVVRVDVEHRKDLFMSPPPVSEGPEAWKP